MADYTWFKLLVRAIGIALVGFAAPDIVSTIGSVISTAVVTNQTPGIGMYSVYQSLAMWSGYILGSLAQLAFGLYLFFGGHWIIQRSLRGVYGHCPSCSYDLRGTTAPTCPECGAHLPGRATTPATPPAPEPTSTSTAT